MSYKTGADGYGQEKQHDPSRQVGKGVVYGPNNLPPDLYDEDGPSQEDEERMGGAWTNAMWRKTAPAAEVPYSERRWY